MTYNYCTLLTVVISYLIFSVFSIKHGKWYYMMFHPYALWCFGSVMAYRYASEISTIALRTDIFIASGFLVATIAFWSAYILIKQDTVEYFTTKIFGCHDGKGISPYKFWTFCGIILFIFTGYYLAQYFRVGNISDIFFQIGNPILREQREQMLAGTEMTITFWKGLFSWASTYFFMTIMYLSIALLFEVLRKGKRVKGYLSFFSILLLALFSLTGTFLIGFRTLTVFAIGSILLLGFATLIYPNRILTKMGYFILTIFIVYTIFWTLTVKSVRHYVGQNRMKEVSRIITKEGVNQSVKSIMMIEEHPLRVNQELSIDLSISKEYFLEQEKNERKDEEIVIQKKITAQEKFKEEERYLKSVRPYNWSVSREIAWEILYFGRHTDFLGPFYAVRVLGSTFLPGRLSKDLLGIGVIMHNAKDGWGRFGGAAVGPLGEGFACYGYTGAYCYWIVWSFLCGIASKFAIVNIFTKTPRLETTALSIFLITGIPILLYAGFYLFVKPLAGFAILFLFEIIIIRLLSSLHRNQS